jgi:SOS response regulatory protein OraA/RecX
MTSRKLTSWILTLAVIAVVSLPALAQNASASSNKETSYSIHTNGGVMRWRTSTGMTDFNIELRGKIEITDDDKDIKSMSDDGYLEINKTVFGSKRSIVVESQGGGKLKKEYYEGRTRMDWEPNGRSWLSEILPDIVRNTTIGAESRVNRFFKQGGVNAVLAEIDRIDSDHAKSIYANLLMKQPVQPKDYATIISRVSEHMESDHYITEFLKGNISKFMQNKEATSAVFSATRKMDSDHYKTVIIKEALQGQAASLENVKIILQAASQMESDHYITEVLTSLLKQNNLNDAIIAEMITTTKSIESDHYKTVVLTKALDKPGLSSTSYQKVIESVKDIESDHYITEVIKDLLNNKLSDEVLTLVLDITTSIESDHYRSDVLGTLLGRQDLTEAQLNKLIESCGRMDSDHYKTVVLRKALASSSITDSEAIAILNSTRQMDSDHYITEVLMGAAPKVKTGSAPLKDAYRNAARSISSETYYGRALRAIE